MRDVVTGIEILRALGLRRGGPTHVSCPTGGRIVVSSTHITEDGIRGGLRGS